MKLFLIFPRLLSKIVTISYSYKVKCYIYIEKDLTKTKWRRVTVKHYLEDTSFPMVLDYHIIDC